MPVLTNTLYAGSQAAGRAYLGGTLVALTGTPGAVALTASSGGFTNSVAFRSIGTYTASTDTAAAYDPITGSLPAGAADGDLLVIAAANKVYASVPSSSGYTSQASGADGTAAPGYNTGSVRASILTKEHSGSESAPSVSWDAGYDPGQVAVLALAPTVDAGWANIDGTTGADTTAAGTDFSATGGATLDCETGDMVVIVVGHRAGGFSSDQFLLDSETLTVPGCTVANLTQRGAFTTTSGNNGSMLVYTADITGGTATGAPVFAGTDISGTTRSNGTVAFLSARPTAATSTEVTCTLEWPGITVPGRVTEYEVWVDGTLAQTTTDEFVVLASLAAGTEIDVDVVAVVDAARTASSTLTFTPGVTVPSTTTGTGWAALPIRSAAEAAAGSAGGEGAQHNHAVSTIVDNTAYLAGDVHQLRKTTDGGATWGYVPAVGLGVSQMFGVEVDEADPDRVVCVGSAGFDYTETAATGIYLSTDGGDTFTLAQALDDDNFPGSMYDSAWGSRARPWRLITQATATDWYCVIGDQGTGTSEGIWKSTNSGASWTKLGASMSGVRVHTARFADSRLWIAGPDGLRYTPDGASLTTPTGTGLPSLSSTYTDLDVDPNDSDTIWVTQGGVYKSTNAGASFSTVTPSGASGCRRVAAHRSSSGYLFVMDGGVSGYAGWVSDDGGSTWAHASLTAFAGLKPVTGVSGSIGGAAWGSTSQLIVAGSAFVTYSDTGSTFAPAEGFTGLTWGRSTGAYFHPTDRDRFGFAGFDNFIVYTGNAGESFEFRKQADVSNNRLHTLGVGWNDAGTVGIVQNRAYEYLKTTDSGATWPTVIDTATSASIAYIKFHDNGSTVYAGRSRSTDGGSTWSTLPGSRFFIGCAANTNDVVWSTTQADAAAAGFYRSTDAGASWTNATGSVPATLSPKAHDSLLVFAAHPNSSTIFYSKNATGDIVKWDDGTVSALGLITGGNARYVRSIAVDPQNPNIIWCVVKDVGASFVYRTVDGGDTWTDVTGDLPASNLNVSCAVSPVTGDLFVSGTYQGVFVIRRPDESPATAASYRDESWAVTV